MPVGSNEERLQKVLAAAGYGSRRACEALIELGRVTVDGETADELGTRVNSRTQTICVDGEQVKVEPKVYWWLNKPPGVLSTVKDPQGRPTVIDLLPELDVRLYPVGRLDEESTGLMLLTNDGALADRLTHPKFGVPKTYDVLVAGRIPQDVIRKLCEGVWLSDGRVRAAAINRLGSQGNATNLRVVLREGHNREIRRMFAKFGHKVMSLQRIAIGPVKIRKLALGQSREATEDEISLLRHTVRKSVPLPPPQRTKVKSTTGSKSGPFRPPRSGPKKKTGFGKAGSGKAVSGKRSQKRRPTRDKKR